MTDRDCADGRSVCEPPRPHSPAGLAYSPAAVFALDAECGKRVEAYVYRRLASDPDSIKVLERAWIDLVAKWQREETLVQPRALLFRLAHQRCLDRLRQLGRRAELLVGADGELLDQATAALTGSAEFESVLVVRCDVRAALRELPLRQQQALVFTYGYGLQCQDTTALMGAESPSVVRNLLRAGKQALRKSRHLSGYKAPAPPEVTK